MAIRIKSSSAKVSMALILLVLAVGCRGGGPSETTTACCSSATPPGYLKTDDRWDPTSCGNPSTTIYNVCTYQRYDDKPKGAVMNVCAGQQLPQGWVRENTSWVPTSCGHPTVMMNNVETIRKAN